MQFFFYGSAANDHMMRSYVVYLNIIFNILKYNLQTALGGCIGITHVNLRDKYHSGSKLGLKTLKLVMGAQRAQFAKINKLRAR